MLSPNTITGDVMWDVDYYALLFEKKIVFLYLLNLNVGDKFVTKKRAKYPQTTFLGTFFVKTT